MFVQLQAAGQLVNGRGLLIRCPSSELAGQSESQHVCV